MVISLSLGQKTAGDADSEPQRDATGVVTPEEFIPDGDLLPLPHTRTQLCHYALRLTQPVQLG